VLLWLQRELPRADNDELDALLQLKLDRAETTLLGTSGNGFVVWELADGAHHPNRAIVLPLPHGVRNISTRVLCSNSCMVSAARGFVVAGVRSAHAHTHAHKKIALGLGGALHSVQTGSGAHPAAGT
jgi:hypothetical protein